MRFKSRMATALMVCCMIAIFLLLFTATGVQGYNDAKETAQLKRTGTRVVAQVSDIHTGYSDDILYYYTDYVYEDAFGTRYKGSTGNRYRTEEAARTHFGEEIQIIIGKNGQSVRADVRAQVDEFYHMMLIGGILLGIDMTVLLTLAVLLIMRRMRAPKRARRRMEWYPAAMLVVVIVGFVLLAGGIAFRKGILLTLALICLFGMGGLASVLGVVSLFVGGGRKSGRRTAPQEQAAVDGQSEEESPENADEATDDDEDLVDADSADEAEQTPDTADGGADEKRTEEESL